MYSGSRLLCVIRTCTRIEVIGHKWSNNRTRVNRIQGFSFAQERHAPHFYRNPFHACLKATNPKFVWILRQLWAAHADERFKRGYMMSR